MDKQEKRVNACRTHGDFAELPMPKTRTELSRIINRAWGLGECKQSCDENDERIADICDAFKDVCLKAHFGSQYVTRALLQAMNTLSIET